MRHLNGVYTQKYNVGHGRDGTLFRGRYKSILVDADSYVLLLVRYIHGIENEPRDVAIYLIRTMRTEPLMRIGAGFGLNRYSSVSSVVMRAKVKLQKDRKFKQCIAHIETRILKGQTYS